MGRSSLIPLTVAGAFMLLLCTFLALRTSTIGDSTDHVLFRDVTGSSKLDFIHANGGTGKKYLPEIMGSGGCALDFDGDCLIDVYLVQSGRLSGSDYPGAQVVNRLFRNLGDGTFRDGEETFLRTDQPEDCGRFGGDFDVADINGDGAVDIIIHGLPTELLLNDGSGSFTRLPENFVDIEHGLGDIFMPADANGDGLTDFIAPFDPYMALIKRNGPPTDPPTVTTDDIHLIGSL